MVIFGIITAVIVVCMVIGGLIHATYLRGKLNQIEPYGQLIEAYDGQMHVYAMGSGEQTIVLLAGMGVPLPCAQFGPLMRKLSEKYTVVCVEYFGSGFSSNTSRARTCANYVEETRTALCQAGFMAPYVVMPHSISSVYSEYYAAIYPEEVAAIISLDGTSTALYGKMPAIVKYVLPILKFQQAIGVTSLLAWATTNKKSLLSDGYTEKEINDMIIFAGFSVNDVFLEQVSNSAEFIKQTMALPFPESVPFFKVIARQTYETPNKQIKMTPQAYQQQHLERIGSQARYEICDGSHFIYLNNVGRIAEIADEMLGQGESIK